MPLSFSEKLALIAAVIAVLTGRMDLPVRDVPARQQLPELSLRQADVLKCRCCGREGMNAAFLRRVLRLQEMWGRELVFTSGFRCAPHNARVGGVSRSLHLQGRAADIAVSAKLQGRFCRLARRAGFAKVLPDAARGYVHVSL